jgi:ribosomal protein L37E
MPTSGQLEIERRRQRSQITIDDLTTCYYCGSTGLKETDLFCPNCAFPQRGTQAQMKKFIWNVHNKKKLLEDQKKAINKARNILYILAGINLVFGTILGLVKSDIPTLIVCVIAAGIYFALGQWSKKQPFPAILSGLFVYIVFNVIAAIADPTTLYQGLIWKVVIISGFIYGYKGVKDSKALEAELESIKKAKDLSIEN